MESPSIMFNNYIDSVMASPTSVRDKMFHGVTLAIAPKVKEQLNLTVHNAAKKITINPEDFEKEKIELCIQNDDKLIGFLSSVKSKRGINAVVLSTANKVIVLIKSQDLHPVLVMIYPIDQNKIYAKSPNLVFHLPLDELMTKSIQSISTANGYALYYKKELDESRQYLSTTLYYRLDDNTYVTIPVHRDISIEYVNLMLQPSSISEFSVRKLEMNNDNLTNLTNMNLVMLVNTQVSVGFRETSQEKSIYLDIKQTPKKISQLEMTTKSKTSATLTTPIANETNALVWGFQNLTCKSWEFYPHSTLLLQNVNSKIRFNSDYIYTGFGRYGSEYVFIKLITSKTITVPNPGTTIVQLSTLLEDNTYIFELYFCHEVEA